MYNCFMNVSRVPGLRGGRSPCWLSNARKHHPRLCHKELNSRENDRILQEVSCLLDGTLDVIDALQQLGSSFMAAALHQALCNCGYHLTDAIFPVIHGNVHSTLPHLYTIHIG